MGLTKVAINPAHAAGSGTLDVDGLTSFVQPATDGTFPDIPHSDVERILDYAHHLATFKQGGQEFQTGLKVFKNFLQAAKDADLRDNLASHYTQFEGGDPDLDGKLENAS